MIGISLPGQKYDALRVSEDDEDQCDGIVSSKLVRFQVAPAFVYERDGACSRNYDWDNDEEEPRDAVPHFSLEPQ